MRVLVFVKCSVRIPVVKADVYKRQLYGYTTCYRYTKDKKYLDQAQKVYNFIFNNKNLPEDLVPYWDYDAPNIPNEPRDASAAACTASALYELDGYLPGNHYKETADKIMESLGSPAYRLSLIHIYCNSIVYHGMFRWLWRTTGWAG